MKLNLLSLAPDSFIIGSSDLVHQFYPKKVFDIPYVKQQVNHCACCKGMNKPWGVEIHLTSNCQLSCLHCSYGKRNQDRCELNYEMVQKILNSVTKLNVGSIIFSGGGDPLAWKGGKFDDILKENAPYSQAIATNGLGLEVLTKILLRRLNIIQINVNGYDKDSFLRATQRDAFDKFTKNLDMLFARRDKNITQITGKILIDNKNYGMIQEYLKFCHQMGFDLIVVKLAGNFEKDQDVSLNQNQKQELRQLIYGSPIINKYPEYLDAIATDDNSVELGLPEKCWVVEYGMYMLIRSNGDVFPCVTSPYTADNRIGNIYDRSLEEMWEQPAHLKIKNKLHADMKSSKCNLSICRHMRYNFLLDEKISSSKDVKSLPTTKKDKPKLL